MRALKPVSVLPASFHAAMAAGWKVVKEESTITSDERQRSGVLLLGRRDLLTRLRIAYTATAKAWTFDAPQPIEGTIAA